MAARLTAACAAFLHNLWAEWREDVTCVFARDPAAHGVLEVCLTYPGVHAVLMHRLAHRLWRRNWKFPARLLAFITRMFTNVDIHPGAIIGRRLFIDHGAGVVIGETAQIGDDVTLYHGTTLGGTSWNPVKRHPTLGNGVLVGAGAKILGPIVIGDNVRIGANSIVIHDVPPHCTVVGIPGRVVQRKGEARQNSLGIDLDHHLIPDPVGKAIACLMERVERLESRLAGIRLGGLCDRCEAESSCLPSQDQRVTRWPGRAPLVSPANFER